MKTNVVNPNGIDILDKTNNVDRDVLKKLEKEGFIENKKLGWYRITMDGKMELKRLQKLKPWR
jgi:ribosomal protein S19E (S16A)